MSGWIQAAMKQNTITAVCACLCLSVINKCCTKNIIIARHIDTPHETTGSFVYSVITY